MPYNNEFSNKIGHQDLINDDEIFSQILSDLELKDDDGISKELESLEKIEKFEINKEKILDKIFAVDGSLAFDESTDHKIAFIKTGEINLERKFQEFDESMDPRILAKYIETNKNIYKFIIPLTFRMCYKKSSSIEESIRNIIYDTFRYYNFDTILKILFFEKWNDEIDNEIEIKCLSCNKNSEKFTIEDDYKNCSCCGKNIFITDVANFIHSFESNSHYNLIQDSIIPELMLYTETLILFKKMMVLYSLGSDEGNFHELERTLFLKDGPLNIDKNYIDTTVKLNSFLSFLKKKNITVHLCGQEKTGLIEDYFSRYTEKKMKEKRMNNINTTEVLFLNDNFIEKKISNKYTYYKNNTYGYRVVVYNKNNRYILSMNTGGVYNPSPNRNDFVGFDSIINTVLNLKSDGFVNALYPINIINQLVTISKEPSIALLSKFVFDKIKK